MPRKAKASTSKQSVKDSAGKSYIDRIEEEVNNNQSKLNLILGSLIILVLGVLVFNYFNKNRTADTQSQNTKNEEQQGDVAADKLPGKYTIKEGDTLFSISEKYYSDGYKFPELVKANNLANPDNIEVGQVIDIPKLEGIASAAVTEAENTPTMTIVTSASPTSERPQGTVLESDWGPKITSDKYTVAAGDWLSKIAGRAYGDVMQYEKIAKANNIVNPDLIEVGTVLTIPR